MTGPWMMSAVGTLMDDIDIHGMRTRVQRADSRRVLLCSQLRATSVHSECNARRSSIAMAVAVAVSGGDRVRGLSRDVQYWQHSTFVDCHFARCCQFHLSHINSRSDGAATMATCIVSISYHFTATMTLRLSLTPCDDDTTTTQHTNIHSSTLRHWVPITSQSAHKAHTSSS